jgi:hypothetical protein
MRSRLSTYQPTAGHKNKYSTVVGWEGPSLPQGSLGLIGTNSTTHSFSKNSVQPVTAEQACSRFKTFESTLLAAMRYDQLR